MRALRAAEHDVVVLDSLELGRADAVIDAPLVTGNIIDHDLVISTCRNYGITQVVHFAAYKSVGESMEDRNSDPRGSCGSRIGRTRKCLR